jgi:hypothetical protein
MQYHISLEFCKKTAGHLARQLDASEPDVRNYLLAFEATVKFERQLSEVFAGTEMIYIGADDPMPEFENTPDGVRQKVEWRMRRDQGIGQERKVPAAEFIGSIAPAFASHMSLYLNHETEQMMQVIADTKKRLLQDIDDTQHQMASVSVLVTRMRDAINKCAGFNLPQSLLDLFLNIKMVLHRYVQFLTRSLPAKPRAEPDFHLLTAIANTSALLLSITDSLATTVVSRITDEFKSAILVDDAKDAIGGELRQQLIFLVDVLARELEGSLVQIGSGSWDQGNPDSGKLPARIPDLFRERFTVLGAWLSNDNMNRLRSTFAARVVGVVHDSMFKQKQFVMDLGWKISTAVKELKALVVQWLRADSALAKKRIDAEFLQLEVEVRVLYSPDPEAMAVTYITMWPKQSRPHYLSILKVRGLSSKDQDRYMEEYDRQLRALAPT